MEVVGVSSSSSEGGVVGVEDVEELVQFSLKPPSLSPPIIVPPVLLVLLLEVVEDDVLEVVDDVLEVEVVEVVEDVDAVEEVSLPPVVLSAEEVLSTEGAPRSTLSSLETSSEDSPPSVASVDTVSFVEASLDTVSSVLGVQEAMQNIQTTATAKINKSVFFILFLLIGS